MASKGISKSEAETRPRIVLVARGIIIYRSKILLIQRAKHDRHDPLLWEFPGGKVDPGQTFVQALEDEIFEEAGIIIEQAKNIAYVEEKINTEGPYAGLLYRVEAVFCCYKSGKVILSSEHNDFKWISYSQALKLECTKFTRKALIELEDLCKKQFKKSTHHTPGV